MQYVGSQTMLNLASRPTLQAPFKSDLETGCNISGPSFASSSRTPTTKCVALTFVVLGAMALLPWNAFLSALDYLDKVSFPGRSWSFYAPAVWQTTCVLAQLIAVMCRKSLGQIIQFAIPLVTIGVGCIAIMFLAVAGASDLSFALCLVLLGVLGSMVGIFQGFLFSVAAQSIDRYGNLPAQVMLGMAIAGIATMVVSLLTLAISGSTMFAFWALFIMTVLVAAVCACLYGTIAQVVEENQLALSVSTSDVEAAQDDSWGVLRSVRAGLVYEVAIFFVFAVTFSVFPSTVLKWRGVGLVPQDSYITLVIGNFQVMDTVGRLVAERFKNLRCLSQPVAVWLLVISRGVFIPFCLACAKSDGRDVFGYQCTQLIGMALLAASNGFAGTICSMGAPEYVPAPARATVGSAMGFSMVAGLMVGSWLPILCFSA